MAKAFATGTENQPDAGSLGLALVEEIRDDLVAHAAWDLVEEFTPATGTCRWYVFKCLSASSGLPADFYVVIGRTLGTGELRFAIAEGYDSTTHTMSKYPANPSGSNIAYDANGCNQTTYVLGTVPFTGATNSPLYYIWNPSSAISSKWWLIIDDDGFTVAFNGAVVEWVHIGAYVPLADVAITLPLQIMGSNSAQGVGGITRNPGVASQSKNGYALCAEGGHGNVSTINGPILGFRGDLRYNDKLQSNQRAVAEMGISIYTPFTGAQADNGWALGKQKRMRVGGGQAPTGFAFGDAYALNGTLWVPFAVNDLRVWDTGVAA